MTDSTAYIRPPNPGETNTAKIVSAIRQISNMLNGQIPPSSILNSSAIIYYVRTDGDDSNNGLSDNPKGAFKTWSHAAAVAGQAFTEFGGGITLQAGSESGTKTFAGMLINTQVGAGGLVISGNGANTVIASTAAVTPAIWCRQTGPATITIQDLKVTATSTNVSAIEADYDCNIAIGSGVVFGAADFAHIYSHDPKATYTILGSSYTIAGNASYHIFVAGGAVDYESCTVSVSTAGITFSQFVDVTNGGRMKSTGNSFSGGSVSGGRFFVDNGGEINTLGNGLNYFPGSVNGTINNATGGVYADAPTLTVSQLPSPGFLPGLRYIVTDSTVSSTGSSVFGTTLSSGGSFTVPVFTDGSKWRIG